MEAQDNDNQTLPKFLAFVLKHCHVTGPYEYEFLEENILMVEAETIVDAYKLAVEATKTWTWTYKNAYDFDVVCTLKDINMADTFNNNRENVVVISVRDFRDYEAYKSNYSKF